MSSSEDNLSIGMHGYAISSLHNILRLLGFDISDEEIKTNLFGNSTEKAIKRIQSENNLDETGIADELSITSLYESAKERGFFSVKGKIVTRSAVAAKGLQVIAIDRNQGKDSILGKAITDDNGNYIIFYKKENFLRNGKQNADIEIKIVDLEDETKIYGTSPVHFNADHDKRINIVLNDNDKVQSKRSEFSQIFNDLTKYVLNDSFSDLKENKDRQDISYLSGKTGWDARLVAMVSLSVKYSHETKIKPEFYYALFRSGLSSNLDELYKTNSEIVKMILKKAIKDQIIGQSLESHIDRNIQLYRKHQKRYLLGNMKPSGVSSLKDLLSISIPKDMKKQKQFVDLYFNDSGNIEEFWTKLKNKFGTDTMKKLQLDTKLAYLTMNNAELIKKLESAPFMINKPDDLIKKGFHKKDKWEALFETGHLPIPRDIPGKNEHEKKLNYVNHMTLLLKKSYPTLVVSDMIKNDELKVNDLSVKDEICNSLNELYEKLDFQIGSQPIEKVLKDNPNTITLGDQALKELKKIQRIYQLTPSDDAMKVLSKNNLTSALSIVQYNRDEFIDAFKERLGGQEIASAIYSKAHQIHSTVLNLVTSCMSYKVNPKIYALSQINEEFDPLSIIENPTLEELFSSFDYCECNHCQSVLSPSAYLVDLLQFINLKKFDSDGSEVLQPTYDKENPLDVLLSKRPDLEHIQLTCENTNTLLPYIDLVNEILEYYVVKRTIDGFKGFNVKDITTIELLANPQFVNKEAYTHLLIDQVYPFALPFNRSLEYLRLLFNHLKIELHEAMEKLRVNDSLDFGWKRYVWKDIFNEFLGISPQEYQILTDSGTRKIPAYFGESETMNPAKFVDFLSNAKVFATKTDITYKELIELVSTKFINPDSYLIPKLQNLAVSFTDIKRFKYGSITEPQFYELIPPYILEQEQENPQYGGDILSWVRNNYQKIMNLIVLAFPEGEDVNCRFDKLKLKYSLPDSSSNHLKEIDFWCLFRFIRLYKKFGWTIEDTDKVITALYRPELLPKQSTDTLEEQKQKLDNGLKDLIIKVAHVRNIMDKLNLKRSKLAELLSLWCNIDVQGKNSLYNRMFLNSSISKISNVFYENGSGEYLQDTKQKIKHQIDILQAAFNLNIKDISLIMEDAGLTNDSDLSLRNVSKINRYSFLAKCLQLSVEELIMIKQMSGLDPFNELKYVDENDIYVNPDILQFIDIVDLIRKSKFKADTLNYYFLDRDITGQATPSTDALLFVAKIIKDGLVRIEQENTVDTAAGSDAVKSKMALVYENTVVDRFFGFLNSVTQYSVDYEHSNGELEQDITDTSDNKIGYDNFTKVLTFRGVMIVTVRDGLKDLQDVSTSFKDAIDKLYSKGQKDFTDFFNPFPELGTLYNKYISSTSPNESDKLKIVLEGIMITLKKKLKQLFVKQTLCSSLDVDLLMMNELLENHIVLHSAQEGNEKVPLIDDFLGMEASGTVDYYYAPDIKSEATVDLAEPFFGNIDFNTDDLPKNPNPNGGKISGVWKFFIEVPMSENFNFYLETDPDAKVIISIDEESIGLIEDANSAGIWFNKEPILLQSGKFYRSRLQITNIKDKVKLKWASKGIGKVVIPLNNLYPSGHIQNFTNSYIRLLKAIGIIQRLDIREKEIFFFSTDKNYQIDDKGMFNSIPVNQDPSKEKTIELFNKLRVLLKYVSLKESLDIKDEILTSIFEDSNAVDEKGEKIILKVTKWDVPFLSSILVRFKWRQKGDIKYPSIDLSKFLRINEAFEIVKKFGVKVDSLLAWTSNNPSDTVIHEVKNALRSKYDESDWFSALQQINDILRSSQRNALVSFILNEMQKNDTTKKINTPDKLFEYFLIDVQMDPCMKTSRIKQAISTTQLFIQRCLMNLEPLVAASSINKNQWEWMQRYRVSEANKKVFLYPENWLEPELRDLKSPFFKELEGELLQEDMNHELAERAVLNYLEKLDEVSKLEICAMYSEEYFDDEKGTRDSSQDILHVFGRTSTGASHKYYYRKLEQGFWRPWEVINVEIEDIPILPVVWNSRLFLFWLNVVTKGSDEDPLPKDREVASLKTEELNIAGKMSFELNLCWSEYYNNRWQPRKTSDFKNPIIFPNRYLYGEAFLSRRGIRLIPRFPTEGSLEIGVTQVNDFFINASTRNGVAVAPVLAGAVIDSFILNDTKSTSRTNTPFNSVLTLPSRSLYKFGGVKGGTGEPSPTLSVPYVIKLNEWNQYEWRYDNLLKAKIRSQVVANPDFVTVTNVVDIPFFYQEGEHVILVQPKEGLVTIPNHDYVFTDKNTNAQNLTKDQLSIPPIWDKPEIVKSLSQTVTDLRSHLTIPISQLGDSKSIDVWNKDSPLKKVILDYKSILYGDVDIGPLGSRHAHLLCGNMISIDDGFELVNEEERQL